MASRIPTSTSVTESAVIEAPFSHVWHLIKLESFSHFWTALSKSEFVKDASPDTDIVQWTFKDGTELEIKLEAHSVCAPSSRHLTQTLTCKLIATHLHISQDPRHRYTNLLRK